MSKITAKSQGAVPIDPSKMETRDLLEGAYMLQASATLLRQAFGIVSMTNTLLDKPLSDKDLQEFAKNFDLVHKTIGVFVSGLKDYIEKRPPEKPLYATN